MVLMNAALICLATNVFFEARGEQIPGQYAVAEVTMRRAEWKKTRVCKVVYARRQFSWTSGRHGSPEKIDPDAWDRAKSVSRMVMRRRDRAGFSKDAHHYHAT